MTTFQLLLMIASAIIFYMFFRQLFSGSHPKRGIDFESKISDEQIGGISRPDKIFSKTTIPESRMDQLHSSADDAVQNSDFKEAGKALDSALILDAKNTETLYKLAYINVQTEKYSVAKSYLEQLLDIDRENDMAQAMLANVLHKLGEDDRALEYHMKSIKLDPGYAPHYFNYANTLYDLGRREEALAQYIKANELDATLEDAKNMIEKLSE